MTKKEAAILRSKKYREKYGDDYFKTIGSKGGTKKDIKKVMETNKRLYGDDFYLRLAQMGKAARKRKKDASKK